MVYRVYINPILIYWDIFKVFILNQCNDVFVPHEWRLQQTLREKLRAKKYKSKQEATTDRSAYQWERSYHSPQLQVGILVRHPEAGKIYLHWCMWKSKRNQTNPKKGKLAARYLHRKYVYIYCIILHCINTVQVTFHSVSITYTTSRGLALLLSKNETVNCWAQKMLFSISSNTTNMTVWIESHCYRNIIFH